MTTEVKRAFVLTTNLMGIFAMALIVTGSLSLINPLNKLFFRESCSFYWPPVYMDGLSIDHYYKDSENWRGA